MWASRSPFPFTGPIVPLSAIYTNGFLTFSNFKKTSFTNGPIPSAEAPNAIIAPFWDDLNVASGGAVYTGTLPDGRFVVQYQGVPRYNTSDAETFEVLLSEDGTIEVQYGAMSGRLTSATVGIEADGGTEGLEVVQDGEYVASNKALRFTRTTVWLTAGPTSGSVAPDTAQEMTLTFDTTGLPEGPYTAELVIVTNDPAQPSTTIPVTLNVGENPGSGVISGVAGWRIIGSPTPNTTVDQFAAMNLVAGVPGYYPTFGGATLFSSNDGSTWVPSTRSGRDPQPRAGRLLVLLRHRLHTCRPDDVRELGHPAPGHPYASG